MGRGRDATVTRRLDDFERLRRGKVCTSGGEVKLVEKDSPGAQTLYGGKIHKFSTFVHINLKTLQNSMLIIF